jgi:hypothetical protein
LVNFGIVDQFPRLPKYDGLLPPSVEIIFDLAHVSPLAAKTVLSARDMSNIVGVTGGF